MLTGQPQSDATAVWAATLTILARQTIPDEHAALHDRLREPANTVNLAAEEIAYPEDGVPPETVEELLALRPAFDEACAELIVLARTVVEIPDGDPESAPTP